MLAAYPHPNAIFCAGLLAAVFGSAGALWNLYDEWKFRKRHRYIVAGIAAIAVIMPAVIVLSALFRNASDLEDVKKLKDSTWHLNPRERITLKENLCLIGPKIQPVFVGAISDPASGQYARDILHIVGECKIEVVNEVYPDDKNDEPWPLTWTNPENTGVFIGVNDLSHPDELSVMLLDAFYRSNMEAKLFQMGRSYQPAARAILVGPRP